MPTQDELNAENAILAARVEKAEKTNQVLRNSFYSLGHETDELKNSLEELKTENLKLRDIIVEMAIRLVDK